MLNNVWNLDLAFVQRMDVCTQICHKKPSKSIRMNYVQNEELEEQLSRVRKEHKLHVLSEEDVFTSDAHTG